MSDCLGFGRYSVRCKRAAPTDFFTCGIHRDQEQQVLTYARQSVIDQLWTWIVELDPNTDTPAAGYLNNPNGAERAVVAGLVRPDVTFAARPSAQVMAEHLESRGLPAPAEVITLADEPTRRERVRDWFAGHFGRVVLVEFLAGAALIAWKNGIT